MSQNFELLRHLETEFRFAEVISDNGPLVATPAEHLTPELPQELLTLAQTVFLCGNANAPQAVVLCGIDRDTGSSEICANLGRVLADYSRRPVCLVDTHWESPRLEKILSGNRPLSPPGRDQDHREIAANLWLADLGIKGTRKQVGHGVTVDLKEQLTALKQQFGFVLIDAPSVNTRPEAAIFSQFADGIILIIEAHVTRKAAALKARRALDNMNVRILGSILNNRTLPIPERLYRKL